MRCLRTAHKVKGVYHINAVDEVTQYQFTGCVERISENFLLPVLERLLESFPFAVQGFHSDNGSEYVNYQVAALLEKLRVTEFTKSRPRRSNDNGLAESKNGSVVRKMFGNWHIAGAYAELLDRFHREVLANYLNYHRPCLFAHVETDAKGKQRKTYRQADIRTPYEALKALPEAESYLRPGVTFAELDRAAYAKTDLEAARELQEARDKLIRGAARGGLRAAALPAHVTLESTRPPTGPRGQRRRGSAPFAFSCLSLHMMLRPSAAKTPNIVLFVFWRTCRQACAGG